MPPRRLLAAASSGGTQAINFPSEHNIRLAFITKYENLGFGGRLPQRTLRFQFRFLIVPWNLYASEILPD